MSALMFMFEFFLRFLLPVAALCLFLIWHVVNQTKPVPDDAASKEKYMLPTSSFGLCSVLTLVVSIYVARNIDPIPEGTWNWIWSGLAGSALYLSWICWSLRKQITNLGSKIFKIRSNQFGQGERQ